MQGLLIKMLEEYTNSLNMACEDVSDSFDMYLNGLIQVNVSYTLNVAIVVIAN